MRQNWFESLLRRNRSGTRNRRPLVLWGGVALALIAAVAIFFVVRGNGDAGKSASAATRPAEKSEVLALWGQGDKEKTLSLCRASVTSSPLDPFYLSFEGISAYYSSLDKPEGDERQSLLDESVFSLRKSLAANQRLPIRPQVEYVLGKAYFQKGSPWFDLAASFLERSKADGYTGSDTEQYLGLAYAGMEMHDKAVTHFEAALAEQPSDILMLSAAMSYKELGNSAKAEELLTKVVDSNSDAVLVQKSRYLLAGLAMKSGDLAKANSLYQAIVSVDPRAAEAWYQIGLICEKRNDPIKARAAWRKVISIDPNHAEARMKLAEKL